ncbi:hypothetical protein FLL45_11620 [Aliikangiella marina]|uniref:Zinc transporter ZntB n=1 Tax=Aliikangiella marina TaxID=1712262 RepID=A0A545TEF5_9GAMM|nr:CorA family divalent cation transporter [Aliikangiella marina]TQV75556.1 hypothetical protein FLL45_11620 [Aliikangiella marina]
MKNNSFLICASEEKYFLSEGEADKCCSNSWSHFDRETRNLDAIVELGAEPNDAASLLEETTRPHVHRTNNNGIILFLRAINLNPNSEPEDMVSLRFWCNGERLITVMNRKVQAVAMVKEKILSNSNRTLKIPDIFVEIIHQTMLRIETHVTKLSEKIEFLEEQIDKNQPVQQSDVMDLKRSTSRLWRFMYPQLDSLKKLSATDLAWMSDNLKYSLKEFVDLMSYYNEELILIKERCEILSNEITSNINDKVNRNLYIISIISVIFLPLGFITGLLGINVGGIPAASSEDGFLYVMIIMGVIFIGQLLLLKIFKWF